MAGPLYGRDLEEEALSWVTVALGGGDEDVLVDPARGPLVCRIDGSMGALFSGKIGFRSEAPDLGMFRKHGLAATKPWRQMTSTEREVHLLQAAKKNRALVGLKGAGFFRLPEGAPARPGEGGPEEGARQAGEALEAERSTEEVEAEASARVQARCEAELERPPLLWSSITVETVTKSSAKRAKGMVYGLEFPWTEAMLVNWGPEWLTQAFHAARTLPEDNRVVKIVPERKVKVTTGNNGGKFLFDVVYARRDPCLHTRLFAKVPFPLEGGTRTDRLSSSVNKQPQELYEINAYRLLEATLPVPTPRYYFGDISNETSNWIIITECVSFGRDPQNFGPPKPRKKPIAPWVIEGPYDKCMDHNLRGEPKDYYMLLVRTGARLAGLHRAGRLGNPEILAASFQNFAGKSPEFFGFSILQSTGEDPRQFRPRLDLACTFISDVGKALFPDYAAGEAFQDKFRRLMFLMNAYSGEIKFWKHVNQDYIALSHPNMNVDNAYFWRDKKGRLDLGVFDWGGLGAMSLGHRLWWWLYCSDHEVFRDHVRSFIGAFASTYEEHGGPHLSEDLLYDMVIVTALEQMVSLCNAVPQIYKMCGKKEWPTIQDRYDPRVSENVDGKSTLRLYLHVMNSIVRIIEEMTADSVLDSWLDGVFVGEWKVQLKDTAVVEGLAKQTGAGL